MLNNRITDYTPLNRSHISSIGISTTNMYTIDLSGVTEWWSYNTTPQKEW